MFSYNPLSLMHGIYNLRVNLYLTAMEISWQVCVTYLKDFFEITSKLPHDLNMF